MVQCVRDMCVQGKVKWVQLRPVHVLRPCFRASVKRSRRRQRSRGCATNFFKKTSQCTSSLRQFCGKLYHSDRRVLACSLLIISIKCMFWWCGLPSDFIHRKFRPYLCSAVTRRTTLKQTDDLKTYCRYVACLYLLLFCLWMSRSECFCISRMRWRNVSVVTHVHCRHRPAGTGV